MTRIEHDDIPGRDEVAQAAAVLDGRLRVTPLLDPGPEMFHSIPGDICLKLELLQHTGSFKPRGALFRALTSEIPASGLIAASGGNHGLAVAWAAQQLGVAAEIFVPEVSPASKVDKLHGYGATVHVGGALYADALDACVRRQRETGALDIHAYDHRDTIAGAGTIAREVELDWGRPDTVLVSVGGGGLASGIAAWTGSDSRVVTVEPASSSCFFSAHRAGTPVDVEVSGVAADSLGARRVGTTNWLTLTAAGAIPVVVADEAIREAQFRLWEATRLVVEPGGAAACAALWSGAYVPEPDERVAVIVCGANCDPSSAVRV